MSSEKSQWWLLLLGKYDKLYDLPHKSLEDLEVEQQKRFQHILHPNISVGLVPFIEWHHPFIT